MTVDPISHLHVVPPLPELPARPPVRGRVKRTRLVRRLCGVETPLVMLVAPAGYGKTSLLRQWQEAEDRLVAWIDVTPDHNAPGALLAALDRAMAPARPPTVVILDDAHHLHASRALVALRTVAEQMAPGSIMAVAARTDLPLPLARMRSEATVTELGPQALAMTEREAGALLRGPGLDLAQDEVASLHRRTEGWPVAIALAGVSLRAQDDVGAGVARFAGDDRVVVDYFNDELLSDLSDDERALLRRSAVLDPLTGPLCDAALRVTGSAPALRDLAHANLPITSLDRAEEEFRVHPLLADALQLELRRDEPELVDDVHRRAAAWHERRGELDRAVEHLTAAGDAGRAAALLWRLAPSFVASNRDAELDDWLARFSEADHAAHPALCVCAAMHSVARGDRDAAERFADIAAHTVKPRPKAQGSPLEGGIALVRAAVARDGLAQMRQDAARAYSLLEHDSGWRAFACLLEGVAAQLSGDAEDAAGRLEEGVRRGGFGLPSVKAICLAQLALPALEQGDWLQGAEQMAHAREVIGAAELGDTAAALLVDAVSAFAAAHGGRVEQARDDARAARRTLATLTDAVPWFAAEVRIALARAELRLSDAAAARDLLGEATRLLRPVPEAVMLHAAIDDAWERADTFAAGAVAGPTSLTTAELRVLRFLPSHLPFREIADRLHVSANTVKSQAHAVYRKLDASSRSEAVARAREVGLVDG